MISPTMEKLAQNLSQAGPAHTPESPACTPVPCPLTQRLGGCSVPPDSGSGPREDRPVPHHCPGRSSWSADITCQHDHRHTAALAPPADLPPEVSQRVFWIQEALSRGLPPWSYCPGRGGWVEVPVCFRRGCGLAAQHPTEEDPSSPPSLCTGSDLSRRLFPWAVPQALAPSDPLSRHPGPLPGQYGDLSTPSQLPASPRASWCLEETADLEFRVTRG